MPDFAELVAIVEVEWRAIALVLVIALLVAWWLWGRGKGSRRDRHRAPDALDEGAEPAARNQALIDAPSAVTAARFADTGPDIFGGIGEAVAMGAASEVAAAAARIAVIAAATTTSTRIKGVGPKLVALLGQHGMTSLAQIAAWDDADIDHIDAQLGTFAGRIRRDNWVEQAKFLAAGDVAGFEGKFGKV